MSVTDRPYTTVSLEGDLSYEKITYLQKYFAQFFQEGSSGRLILNLAELDFVGSSGIGTLVTLINEYNQGHVRIVITKAQTEFVKVFQLYGLKYIDSIILEEVLDSSLERQR